jgi:hypothetical protein
VLDGALAPVLPSSRGIDSCVNSFAIDPVDIRI